MAPFSHHREWNLTMVSEPPILVDLCRCRPPFTPPRISTSASKSGRLKTCEIVGNPRHLDPDQDLVKRLRSKAPLPPRERRPGDLDGAADEGGHAAGAAGGRAVDGVDVVEALLEREAREFLDDRLRPLKLLPSNVRIGIHGNRDRYLNPAPDLDPDPDPSANIDISTIATARSGRCVTHNLLLGFVIVSHVQSNISLKTLEHPRSRAQGPAFFIALFADIKSSTTLPLLHRLHHPLSTSPTPWHSQDHVLSRVRPSYLHTQREVMLLQHLPELSLIFRLFDASVFHSKLDALHLFVHRCDSRSGSKSMPLLSPSSTALELERVFSKFNSNGDNKISSSELTANFVFLDCVVDTLGDIVTFAVDPSDFPGTLSISSINSASKLTRSPIFTCAGIAAINTMEKLKIRSVGLSLTSCC